MYPGTGGAGPGWRPTARPHKDGRHGRKRVSPASDSDSGPVRTQMGSRKRGPSRCRAALLRHASEGCGCGARACAACEAGAMRRGSRESEYGIRLGVRCVCVCVHEAPPGVKACSFHGWCEDRVRSAREADARMGCMGWYRHPHRDSSSARQPDPAANPAGRHPSAATRPAGTRRRPDSPAVIRRW